MLFTGGVILKLIKIIVSFFHRRLNTFDDGGLSMLFTWLMSSWIFIPLWLYASNFEQIPLFTLGELLWVLPVASLIIFPIGIVQYVLYFLAITGFHRLLNKPHIITD